MHSVTDDDHRDHDHGPEISALRAEYPAWLIRYEAALRIFSAELRQPDGAVRYLAGHTIAELAARLGVATTVAGP